MRIAPKPQPGQEVSLESLLNGTLPSARIDPREFSITIGAQSILLTGVQREYGICMIETQIKPLLPDEKTSDWVFSSREAVDQGHMRAASCEELYTVYSLITAAAESEDARLRELAEASMSRLEAHWEDREPKKMFTYFCINPSQGGSQDMVEHLRTTFSEKIYTGRLAGENGYLDDARTGAAEACRMLFGESDATKVNSVLEEIMGLQVSLNRMKKPTRDPISGLVLMGKGYVNVGSPGFDTSHEFPSIGIKVTIIEAKR